MSERALSSPDTKAGVLQRACLEILREHEATGALPTSCRFVYYELVQRGLVPKHEQGKRTDQPVSVAIMHLRLVGLVPWDWISDETRDVTSYRYAPTVSDYVADTVATARIDLWNDQRPPLIITESRSLAGVLGNLAYLYLVPITSTNGQCGGHLRTSVAPLMSEGDRVAYLGDHDFQGDQIEANTRKVLEDLVGELDWVRLAITAEQVREHNLPVISKPDRRFKPARFHDAVETEALGQRFITDIVRGYLDSQLPEPIEDARRREQEQRDEVAALLRRIVEGSS